MADRLKLEALGVDGVTHLCTLSDISGVVPETANSALGIGEPTTPLAMQTVEMSFGL